MSASESAAVHSATMRIVRQLIVTELACEVKYESDVDVLALVGFLAPCNSVRCARLSLFVRVAVLGGDTLVRSLHAARKAKRSWVRAVEADFAFLCLHSDKLQELAGAGIATWSRCARADPICL